MSMDDAREVFWRKFDQTDETLVPPRSPWAVLQHHVMSRGMLLGSSAGLVTGSLLHLVSKQGGATSLAGRAGAHAAVGAAIGGMVMAGVAVHRVNGDHEALEDRALRLKYNAKQNQLDRYLLAGAVAGAVAAPVMFNASPVRGAAMGLPISLALFAALPNMF